MLKYLKELVSEKVDSIKGLDRSEKRKIERELKKSGMDDINVEHELMARKNRPQAEEIYELLSESLLQLGFYVSPEMMYSPKGIRTGVSLRAMTHEDYQKYCKGTGIVFKKTEKKPAEEPKPNEVAVKATEEKCKLIIT